MSGYAGAVALSAPKAEASVGRGASEREAARRVYTSCMMAGRGRVGFEAWTACSWWLKEARREGKGGAGVEGGRRARRGARQVRKAVGSSIRVP